MLNPRSPQKFRLTDSNFAFDLAAVDVDHLKKNLAVIDTEIRNVISSNFQEFKPKPINWQWANIRMIRSGDASQVTLDK